MLFCAVALVAIVTPGPTVLLALSNGSRYGLRLASLGMAGAVASDLVLVAAAALGLGALLAASEFWFSMVKWLGVAYLAYLGLQMLASKAGAGDPPGPAGDPAVAVNPGNPGNPGNGPGTATGVPAGRTLFRRSFLVSVTNPKGYLFVSAFLPQFVDATQPQLAQYLVLAVVFSALDFLVMFAYAFAGARANKLLRSRGARWLDRICGGLMVAAAASLAAYRRST
jgi:threonine/homoserine/homoserine lactone efflux protein